MQTKVSDFAPMRSTVPTCVAATSVFRTVAENAIIFLWATSAVDTIPPRLAATTTVFTSLQNRDMSVLRLHKQAQHTAAVPALDVTVDAVAQGTVTQLAPRTAALSPTLLQALQVKVASQTAVGQAFNGVQAVQAASAELRRTFQCCCGVPVLVRMSDVGPRPAVRTMCVKMPAPPKVCGYKRNRVGGLLSLAFVRYQPLTASQVGNAVTLDNPRPMGGASLLTRSQVSLNQGKRRSRCFRYVCIYTTALFRHPNTYDTVGDMHDGAIRKAMQTCIRVSPSHWSQIVTSALADIWPVQTRSRGVDALPERGCNSGRADAGTRYATVWAWDVQRCAHCSDIPAQEGLDILAKVMLVLKLTPCCGTVAWHARPGDGVCTDV
jgi:hypothetical protein